MKVTYDREADAMYIKFREAKVEKSSDVADGIVLDYGVNGELIGIEVLHASVRIPDPQSISYSAEPEAPRYDPSL